MPKHIYNIRAITSQLRKTQDPNAYYKLTQTFRGVSNVTPIEMIEEAETVIDKEYKKVKAFISKLKKEARKLETV